MKQFLQINPADTVAVALQDLPGIPAGHKFALRDIAEGEDVIKYGYPIGHATRDIGKGELVDHHNIATNLRGTMDYSSLSPDPSPVLEGSSVAERRAREGRLVPDSTSPEARRKMREWAEWIMDNCPFDQLLRERSGNSYWIHVSLKRVGENRQMVRRIGDIEN